MNADIFFQTYPPFHYVSGVFMLLIALFFTECANLSTIPTEMEPSQVARLLETNQNKLDLVIIDVRTPKEFDESHIENAVNIDFYSSTFKKDLGRLDKTKNYLLYCRSGNRSAETRKIMKELGFRNAASITGGIIKWENEGNRTVTTEMGKESQ
jgi:rhodanese-related sulfurtransferase